MIEMEQEATVIQRIELESTSENIAKVEKLIDEVCEVSKVNQDYYGNILIAITEAVNNAIVHGNKKDPHKKFSVSCSSKNEGLCFTVSDEGEGFDFDNLPDPTDPENIEKPNGRGVFLMRNLADEVNFEDDGRIVQLDFNLS